jgi:hypothetical protein
MPSTDPTPTCEQVCAAPVLCPIDHRNLDDSATVCPPPSNAFGHLGRSPTRSFTPVALRDPLLPIDMLLIYMSIGVNHAIVWRIGIPFLLSSKFRATSC